MANQAQCTDILEVAFPSAFRYRENMIRVPQRFPTDPAESPVREEPRAMRPAGTLQIEIGGARVGEAKRADAAVAQEHLVAQVARVGSKTPLVHAPIRAESRASGRNFEIAPSAERSAAGALRKCILIDKTAGHGPELAHSMSAAFAFERSTSCRRR